MTKMSNETYLLKQFDAIFHRYCDTWKGKTKRKITINLIYVAELETVTDALIALGFKQGIRNPRRFTKWDEQKMNCTTCSGEVRRYYTGKRWHYECVGCGYRMRDCVCSSEKHEEVNTK